MSRPSSRSAAPLLLTLAPLLFTLACYTEIGLQMSVVPLFVHHVLGWGTVLAGFAVSAQYLATLATRTWAGERLDTTGARSVVITGLIAGAASGLLLITSDLCSHRADLSLTLLLAGRALLGFSESWVAVGVIMWNLYRAGPENAATVISWNGVCSYGGIALGAPIASLIFGSHSPLGGLTGVGVLCAVMMGACVLPGLRMQTTHPQNTDKQKLSLGAVIRGVLPHGCALGAASIGFGAIVSCLTLYFDAQHWKGAAFSLTLFGTFFVLTRFVFSRMINRVGGEKVAIVSMAVEALGLFVLAFGHTPLLAHIGASLTGVGFSLIFPALGVLAIERLGPENRGVALGGFSVFLDLAIGVSGPGLGLIIPLWGFSALFSIAAVFSLIGLGLTVALPRGRR
ncbi:major facilitator superfamily transporter [Acetobacter estunensis NRIC 0472]|uniref:MFS transporter n=1 Tax=Acetobacter estunensis TaxID=104097 RepID=A0A967EBS8_9PROT|nr:MFS transporter [Acetobacter estunensis]NHO53813.1 MFS transporter [Acetobacter estunensis]GBQ22510.1 major facilitator superfamily transporter [Acetobacter estunensis NRIC 0472]